MNVKLKNHALAGAVTNWNYYCDPWADEAECTFQEGNHASEDWRNVSVVDTIVHLQTQKSIGRLSVDFALAFYLPSDLVCGPH